jgi:hypothetical protein
MQDSDMSFRERLQANRRRKRNMPDPSEAQEMEVTSEKLGSPITDSFLSDEASSEASPPEELPNEPDAPPDDADYKDYGDRELEPAQKYQWEPYTPPNPALAGLCHNSAGTKPEPSTSQPMSRVSFAKVKSKLTRNLNLRARAFKQHTSNTIGRVTRTLDYIDDNGTEAVEYQCAWAVFSTIGGGETQRPAYPGEIDETTLWDIL